MTIAGLSTQYAGFCAPALLGAICPRTTELEEHPPPLLSLARRGVWAGLLEAVMDDLISSG